MVCRILAVHQRAPDHQQERGHRDRQCRALTEPLHLLPSGRVVLADVTTSGASGRRDASYG